MSRCLYQILGYNELDIHTCYGCTYDSKNEECEMYIDSSKFYNPSELEKVINNE